MMKRDISANLNQKCLSFCRKILLNVLFNTSLTVLLPWQHTGFQTSPYQMLFWPPLPFHFDISNQHFICMIQQAYRQVSSSLRPCLTFSKLKITNILKSSGWGLEKSELPWERNFLQPQVCFLQNYQPAKFQCSALEIGQDSPIYMLDIILG